MNKNIIPTLKYAWNKRNAWWFIALAKRNEKFSRTKLGSFWIGISRILVIMTIALVYSRVLEADDFGAYVVNLGIGLTMWATLSGNISSSTNIFKRNSSRILNTNINPIIYICEEWAQNIQNFSQTFVYLLIYLSFYNQSLIFNLLVVGIPPLINFFIFIFWLPILIGFLGLKFKDLFQLTPIFLRLVFLTSPFLFERKLLGDYAFLCEINPLYQVIGTFRQTLVEGRIPIEKFLPMLLLNLVGLFFALAFLENKKKILPFII